ncbi:MAG TPA: hypothetical protein VFK47_08480 [Ktedonobacteraceae bacterium]|nr:hypothetical protein [Ktedonobacteraceae bacterium]
MTEADIQTIVQEVMRRMFAESNLDVSFKDGSVGGQPARQVEDDTIVVSTVITRNDIVGFASAGKKRLVVQHGGLVTPLARDLAAEHGIKLIWASEVNATPRSGGTHQLELAATQRTYAGQDGQTALTCLRCSSCLEPAFYERALSEMEHTTARVLGELRAYIARCWLHEPADITQLRSISRPPMGNLPCCFYANFNLFWAGENLQVCRQLVKDGGLPVQVVCQTVAGLLERHAARLEKWSMTETVALERMLAQYFKGKGLASSEEFLAVIEHTLIALDRVQSWIDGLLPWNELDARLSLRRPISVI